LADVAQAEEKQVEAVKNKVILVPQESDLLGVGWEIAEVDLLTQLSCSVPRVARTLLTLPAITHIPTYNTKRYK
jgi:hypothetical protein